MWIMGRYAFPTFDICLFAAPRRLYTAQPLGLFTTFDMKGKPLWIK